MNNREATFEVYEDNSGEWRWRVVATNGEIIGASSEGFANKGGAHRNARLLRDQLQVLVRSTWTGGNVV